LDGALQQGGNNIEIRITTTLGNYLKSMKDNAVTKRWIHWQKDQSMGMVGPVRLM